ncbi:MAG: oligoendopeptidase F [Caldilineales bacterium]|nr:oligoendopeptidase F [Caldilineales bacterium]
MTTPPLPTRAEIDPQYTWNAESVFPSTAAWQQELAAILADLSALERYRGQLHSDPATLAAGLALAEELRLRVMKIYLYAAFSTNVDTTDPAASAMTSEAGGLYGRVRAATAFVEPELLAIGQETLQTWLAQEPALAIYDHYLEDLFRKQAHVRSAEVEELLGLLADPLAGIEDINSKLTNADMTFAPAVDSEGHAHTVSQSTYDTLLKGSNDRALRRSAWESYADAHLAHKHTLAANLQASIKANVFQMRARRHQSTLAASLFEHAIPVAVFHNLIDTFQAHLPTWHRYWRVRRQALGYDTLQPYDIWAPLTPAPARVSFPQAVSWICAGLAPLGQDYVEIVRRGCLEERWIDVYPNQGKSKGAFSWGVKGTHPFIMMSYGGTLFDLSTLAHELGHSLHSYHTWQQQPVVYSDYSLFVAEVASNFHQALVRAHLLQTQSDPNFQINLIEEAMSNFHRYFLIMPTLARFELEMHERVEQGQGLTAEMMIERMADLFAEAYGPEMAFDRSRLGITWAMFGHLYADYYVYQYATGISGAHALANRVLREGAPAATAYRQFLSAGNALYPLAALQAAGVDLASPQPVQETFAIMGEYIDRLEQLTA